MRGWEENLDRRRALIAAVGRGTTSAAKPFDAHRADYCRASRRTAIRAWLRHSRRPPPTQPCPAPAPGWARGRTPGNLGPLDRMPPRPRRPRRTRTRRLWGPDWPRGYGGRQTARQLQKSNTRKYRSSDEAEVMLGSLVALGLGGAGGGQRKRTGRGGCGPRFGTRWPRSSTRSRSRSRSAPAGPGAGEDRRKGFHPATPPGGSGPVVGSPGPGQLVSLARPVTRGCYFPPIGAGGGATGVIGRAAGWNVRAFAGVVT